MNTEKVCLLAMERIEDVLHNFVRSYSFTIDDASHYDGRCEVVNASDLEELIEKLFEDVKR